MTITRSFKHQVATNIKKRQVFAPEEERNSLDDFKFNGNGIKQSNQTGSGCKIKIYEPVQKVTTTPEVVEVKVNMGISNTENKVKQNTTGELIQMLKKVFTN